jgi:hypothetical protein
MVERVGFREGGQAVVDGVGGGEARAELARDLEGLDGRQAADPPQQRGQVLAVHVLHGDVVQALISPMSYTRQTLGWVTWRAIRTSP